MDAPPTHANLREAADRNVAWRAVRVADVRALLAERDELKAQLAAARAQRDDALRDAKEAHATIAAIVLAQGGSVAVPDNIVASVDARLAAYPPRPCGDCAHDLRRHVASGEGLCLDCKCFGWCPLSGGNPMSYDSYKEYLEQLDCAASHVRCAKRELIRSGRSDPQLLMHLSALEGYIAWLVSDIPTSEKLTHD